MKSLIWTYLLIIVLSVACSRNNDIDNALSHAESVMEDYPDSALAILDTINPASLRGDRQKALYTLLQTQYRYKKYCTEDSDSLINETIGYFIDSDDRYHLMKSYFLKGWINYSNEYYYDAMLGAMGSLDIAQELSDNYYIAKSYELASLISHDTYNLKDAIKYTEKSIHYYRQPPVHELNARYCVMDLALNYSNQSRYEESLNILDSLYQNEESYDSVFIGEMGCIYLSVLYQLNRFDDMKTVIEKYGDYPYILSGGDTYDYKILSHYYLISGDVKRAKEYIDSARNISADANTDVDLLFAEYEFAKFIDNDSMRISVLEKLYGTADLKFKRLRDDVALKAERNFFQNEAVKHQEVADGRYYIIILLIVSAIVVCLSIGWFLTDKNKKLRINKLRLEGLLSNTLEIHHKEFVEKEREIERLKRQLSENKENSESLDNKIKILENQIKDVKSRQLAIESNKLTITQNPIVQKILMESKAEDNLSPISKEEWECLYDIIKTAHPYFFEQLYAVHSLSDFQMQLSVLMKIGVNNAGIAKLLYKSSSAITMQQRRLYDRLNKINGSFTSWKDFIDKI